jgi:murein DD-endopeptidase MepM/ murein hydrolase activator NlpD
MKKKPERKKGKKSLLKKYRLVILDESSFEEKFSLMLSRFNVFLGIGTTSVILIVGTILLVAYSSLREYIPGYASTELRRSAINLNFKTDSLIRHVGFQESFINRIQLVLNGELDYDTLGNEKVDKFLLKNNSNLASLSPSDEELLLRKKLSENESLAKTNTTLDADFQVPLKGILVLKQNVARRRFGIAIQSAADQKVLSMKEGTVLSVEGTPSLGYSVSVQHKNGALSRYSTLSSSNKKPGDYIKRGGVLGLLMDAPEDKIPEGHFEYWLNEESLDLQKLLGL